MNIYEWSRWACHHFSPSIVHCALVIDIVSYRLIVLWYDFMSFYVVSYSSISYHIISYCVVVYCDAVKCVTKLRHKIHNERVWYCIVSFYVVSYRIISFHFVSYHIVLSYTVVSISVILCCILSFCIVLYHKHHITLHKGEMVCYLYTCLPASFTINQNSIW